MIKIACITIICAWSLFGISPDDITVYEPKEETEIVTEEKTDNQKTTTYSYNKGWVQGGDELHINGYPTNGNGYTNNPSYDYVTNGAKGWVYDTDELHVTGLPSDPETGYTKAGNYGIIK